MLRFVGAIDAPRVLDGDLQHIAHPTLKRALDFKKLSDDGEVDKLGQLEMQLDELASYDDQSSVVALYLAAETEYLDREPSSLLPRLQAVMNSGYGLATFWYAIWLSESLTPEDYVSRNPGYVQYCETMQLAYDQGLEEIASPYLNQGC